ncbi:endomucin isoform X1 [Pyxicephalus adspersus]|uniref:endomucin isoform X1 n=1 Tax=Pyxicephalus adspersus TaxID=30357 RepID=UPI003B5B506B
MLERAMKPFGAAAVFLAVINLLTVSSSSGSDPEPSSPQTTTPAIKVSQAPSTSTPLISNSPTGSSKPTSSPTVGSNQLNQSQSATTEYASSTSSSRSTTISTVSSPPGYSEEIHNVSTSDDLNKDVNGSTVTSDKMPSTSPKQDYPIVSAELTTMGTKASAKPGGETQTKPTVDEKVTTEPSGKAQTQPTIHDKDSMKQDNSDSSGGTKKTPASNKDSNKQDSNDSSGATEKRAATSTKGIKIGAGCVAAVIAVIVLVVIYKICQRKPPTAENPEVKASAETKENVKLLSVKTDTPNSDMKRTSSNQMESIEC